MFALLFKPEPSSSTATQEGVDTGAQAQHSVFEGCSQKKTSVIVYFLALIVLEEFFKNS